MLVRPRLRTARTHSGGDGDNSPELVPHWENDLDSSSDHIGSEEDDEDLYYGDEGDNNPSEPVNDGDEESDEMWEETSTSKINSPHSNNRRYSYVKRKRKEVSGSSRREVWLSALDSMTEPKLRRMFCCKNLSCFKNVDYSYFMQRAKEILSSSSLIRGTILHSFKSSNNSYFFNGKEVCVRFLKAGFHFSTKSLADGRRSQADDSNGAQSMVRVNSNHMSSKSDSISCTSSRKSFGFNIRSSPQKDSIISFLLRLCERSSEKMPDKRELHLPFFQKREVYCIFLEEFKKLYKCDPPTPQYFFRTWKENCRHIKVRKSSRFTVCDTCEEIRAALSQAIKNGQDTRSFVLRKTAHVQFIGKERMEYQQKKDKARLDPSYYCSIIVDGADQSAFGLPHFTTVTKSRTGHSLKVKLIGVLEHNIENNLHLYTMTQEHETGANHIIETIHRFLNERRKKGPLPPVFFVQVDNCSRENKNRYFMSYLESLVSLKVFQSIEVAFLPVGHTHEDIDQSFSQTSGRLHRNNAITLNELHSELCTANQGRSTVTHMKRIINWSGLCESQKCLQRVSNITQFRYFKFTPSFSDDDNNERPLRTECHTKQNCEEAWKPLWNSKNISKPKGFISFTPNFNKTPPLKINCPDGVQEVTKRLISEEGRINNENKMAELQELRDFVFSSRMDDFHWDLHSAVEIEHYRSYFSSPSSSGIDNDHHSAVTAPELATTSAHLPGPSAHSVPSEFFPSTSTHNRVSYTKGFFVIVQIDSDGGSSSEKFWLGKILDVILKNGENFAEKLIVHWFDSNKKLDALQCQYYPCYQTASRECSSGKKVARKKLEVPWKDTIHTDTVLVTFEKLTTRNTLPLSVQKKLRY